MTSTLTWIHAETTQQVTLKITPVAGILHNEARTRKPTNHVFCFPHLHMRPCRAKGQETSACEASSFPITVAGWANPWARRFFFRFQFCLPFASRSSCYTNITK